MNKLVIAVDGPAGAGKSTISKLVAEKLNITYIDTGAMYRAVTLKMLRDNIPFKENLLPINFLKNIDIRLDFSKIYLNGEDVSLEIRKPRINENVSIVAAMPSVRYRLVEIQREMSGEKSCIMDGRDIGTNVLKDASVKIFLTASVDERAKRRFLEMTEKGMDVTIEQVKRDIENRDKIDSTRETNPLRKAEDAVELDTTGKGIRDVVEEILSIIDRKCIGNE